MNPEIAICIITYKRLSKLKLCINSIANQTTSFDYDIIIVDNDSESKIETSIYEIAQEKKLSIKYHIEHTKGIASARNKCVEIVRSKYKYLVFIDDDEEALDNWLDSLVNSIKKFQSDIVAGPVISEFEDQSFSFINKRSFFNRKRPPTGTLLKNCRTGNLIANTKIFNKYPIPFEEKFKTMGGSDSHFFKTIHKDGFITKWDNQAIVKEIVSKERTKLLWIIKRMLRVGASNAYSDYLNNLYKKILRKCISSVLTLPIYICITPIILMLEIITRSELFIKHLNRLFKLAGYLFGSIKIKVNDYK